MTYVVIEGLDGAGKTCLAHALVERAASVGAMASYMTEPSKRPGSIGAEIRRRIAEGPTLEPWEAIGLFVADRRAQLASELRPALDSGAVVIQDRNWLSTAVYQGFWQDPSCSERTVMTAEQIAHEHVKFMPPPDVLFLLDVPGLVAKERTSSRAKKLEQYEQASINELDRRRWRYSAIVRQHAGPQWWGRAVVLDATRPKEDVLEQAWAIVGGLLS